MSEDLRLALPPELLDAIAERVAEKLRLGSEASPWMTRKQAATYLGVPLSRLEKDRSLPSHPWKGRVLYNRAELDSYLEGLGP